MQDYFWAWKKESTLPKTPGSFDEEFAEVQATGEDEFEYRHDGSLFRFKFQWQIESLPDGRSRITEDAFISWRWMLLCLFSMTGVLISATLFDTLEGVYSFISMILTMLAVSTVAGCYVALVRASSPVNQVIDRGSNVSLLMPAATLILVFLPVLYLTVNYTGYIRLVGIFSFLLVCIVYWTAHQKITAWSFRWQRTVDNRGKSIPMVTGKYIASLLLGSIPPVIFLLSYDAPMWILLMDSMPYTAVFLFSIPLILSQLLLINNLSYEEQISEIERFTTEGTNIKSDRSVWLSVLATAMFSFLYLYLTCRFAIAANIFYDTFHSVPAAIYIVICGLPALYFGLGTVYQLVSFLTGIHELIADSQWHDFSEVYDCDAETYLLNHPGLVAGAFSIGVKDFIVVSRGYRELLDDDALAAILAHEEGHLVTRDAQIATTIAAVSPFLFVGKNALFALFNFHERELKADAHAIEKTDEDSLKHALQQMQIYKAREKVQDSDSVTGVIPTVVSFGDSNSKKSFVTRYFGFFYGTFAIQEAHPSLSQRIDPLL
jgi:Zn-dependent protease with chaperone function